MTTDELRRALRNQPFRPFTLRTASGRQYTVSHPEFVALSRGGRTIAVFSTEENAFEILDLLLVESIRYGTNGTGRRRSA
jgi:phosphoribulokinase